MDRRNPTEEKIAILLVDDNRDTVRALKVLLERRNFVIHTAYDVHAALEVAHREKIDIVLCDIGLPDGSGLELMSLLRQEYGVIGIALSGYGMAADIQTSMDSGVLIHLVKPSSITKVLDAINEAVSIIEANPRIGEIPGE